MRKRFLILLLVLTMLCPAPALAAVEKNETVYGLLDHDGTVKEVQVVNWAHGKPKNDSWIDHGKYQEVNNSGSDIKPQLDKTQVSWPASAFGKKGLFYQGITDKELPFKVTIDYTLDGKPIKAEDLAGKSGTIKVKIKLENLFKQRLALNYKGLQGRQLSSDETLYTPFAFQVSTTIPAGKWENVKTPDASQIVIGDEIQVGWMVVPFPDEELTLEIQGDNLELAPIEIAVVPTTIPSLALDMEDELSQMISGFGRLEDSLKTMADGASEIRVNQEKIATGYGQFATGVGELEKGIQGVHEGSGQLVRGFAQLRDGHRELAQSNQMMTQQLLGLIQNLEMLNQQSPMFPEEELQQLKMGIQMIDQGITEEKTALDQFYEHINGLHQGLAGLHQGAQQLSQQTPALGGGLKELANGQKQLTDGLLKAADGISTTKQETENQYDELKRGEAITDKLEELADGYRSFMDNDHNNKSQVQFIMRTEGIESADNTVEPVPEQTDNTPWQVIKNFFTGLFS